ncbi:MAG: glutamate racemase [Clostridia bacterium]|nr:glutamate racemase [Clostridia bacterium]
MHNSGTAIGIFDSGIGGLTVLDACRRALPGIQYLYYGDNPNAPYGEKSGEEILRLVRRGVGELRSAGAEAVVLACNTATAVCAEILRSECPFPIVGMEPAVKPAGKNCRRVLVLATPRTAESARLHALVKGAGQGAFTVCPAPRFAGAIERALTCGESLTLSDHLPRGEYDGVVLGCTHYIYFDREIGDFYGAQVFDGVFGTANRLRNLIENGMIGTRDHRRPVVQTVQKGVTFLGEGAKINNKLYNTNKRFLNI